MAVAPTIAPYDPAALGQSKGGVLDTTVAQNDVTRGQNQADYNMGLLHSNTQFGIAKTQMTSSLGATGQLYGSAGQKAQGQLDAEQNYQNAQLKSSFDRSQSDLLRQQAFAAMGIIL